MTAADDDRTKASVYRFGIGGQFMCYGPGVAAGTCNAMINTPLDINATVQDYFGVVSPAGDGVSFTNTWDGTVALADHDRLDSWGGYFSPVGVLERGAGHPPFATQAAWADLASYTTGDIVWNNAEGGVGKHYIALTDHTADDDAGNGGVDSNEPGSAGGGEATGIWKLIRHLWPTGDQPEDHDELYHIADLDGTTDDEYELNDLSGTATFTLADIISEMETAQGGFE
jgi:hypothetical protein